MHLKWIRNGSLVLAGIALMMAPAGRAYANCASAPVFHGFTSSFEQCGPAAAAFFWNHGRAVQRILNTEANGATPSAAGHDSGVLQSVDQLAMTEGPNGGAPNGSYQGNTDFADTGADGCGVLTIAENPTGCAAGSTDWGVLDYTIGGVDPADPNHGRIVALSVDFNQNYQAHTLDSAGAVSTGVGPCGGDQFVGPAPFAFNCTAIPIPSFNSSTSTTGGSNIVMGIGDVSAIPIVDDCAVAETAVTNCPRNMYAGRVLVYKHGACSPNPVAGFDRRTFIFPPVLPAALTTITPNWTPYSVEDANLNGVLDAGEDGTHGGTVNGVLDPFIISGTAAATPTVFVPAVTGATDCIYFGMTIGLDNNKLAVNPPTNTIFGEMVLAPVVSVNPIPVRAGSATPVSDAISSVTASKSQGKGTVNWDTGIESATAGFNVIGTKKGGAEVKLNSTLIAAKEGTTGRGASYTATFDGGQLKGSTQVYVEIVKTDGSKERFGPASF